MLPCLDSSYCFTIKYIENIEYNFNPEVFLKDSQCIRSKNYAILYGRAMQLSVFCS